MVVEAYDHNANKWELVIDERAAYGERNYSVFGALAGVRRSYGLAPIAAPRGLPKDMAEETKAWAEHGIDHTPSWLTLAEVLNHDWDQWRVTNSAWVNAAVVLDMMRKKTDEPSRYRYDISGGSVVTCSVADLKRLILDRCDGEIPEVSDALEAEMGPVRHHCLDGLNWHYAKHEWMEPLAESCQGFLTWARALTSCQGLPFRKPEEIRLVFGFDS
jgi:hypothetical protein